MGKSYAELVAYRDEIQTNLRGLGQISVFGWTNLYNLLLRRRESYLLGELRGVLVAISIMEQHKGK